MFFIAKDPVVNTPSHIKFPKEYYPGQKQIVYYTVHNLKNEPIKHGYVVDQTNNTARQQLAIGAIDIQFNDAKELAMRTVPVDIGERS